MEAQDHPIAEGGATGSLIAMGERLAANPQVDPDKLERLLSMQERILDRQAEQAFAAAMNAAQAKMPRVVKRKKNDQTHSNYAPLEDIIEECSPVWTDNGFSLSFGEEACPKERHLRLICDVRHRDGHCVRYWIDLALDDAGLRGSANKTQTHASGSTISYARRYLTCMIFHIPTGDDNDGNGPPRSPVAEALGTITPEQGKQLRDLITETGANEERFLQACKVDVERVEQIPPAKFNAALMRLKQRKADLDKESPRASN